MKSVFFLIINLFIWYKILKYYHSKIYIENFTFFSLPATILGEEEGEGEGNCCFLKWGGFCWGYVLAQTFSLSFKCC